MGTLMHSDSKRLYSWWWDSHNSPKNSKWLQENLTDLDAKVKSMIKIINEDADSFAKRADMYYKKRPELMKLVEDFYRAYRALAERYSHATSELRMAHKTMSEVFPNQVPSMLSDDTPSGSEPASPVNPHLVRAFFDPDYLCKDSDVGLSKKGLKQLNEMFQTEEAVLQDLKSAEERLLGNLPGVENKDLNFEQGSCSSSDDSQNLVISCKSEAEFQNLREALAEMETERDTVLDQYRESMEKVSNLEKELSIVQIDAGEVDNHAREAQNEVTKLKKLLLKLEAERDASLNQYIESSQKLASLEVTVSAELEKTTNLSDRALKAENECQSLKEEISVHETEKHESLVRYEQCIEKIFTFEEIFLLAEEKAKQLNEKNDLAEIEIKTLKHKLSGLNEEKEDAYLRYQQCLDTISKLENELMEAREDIRRLSDGILSGSAKLRAAEDQCALIEKMNEYLKFEADDLIQQIAEKDEQLFQKHADLANLMSSLQNEESRFTQVEATLNSLQNLHSQSQEEHRSLALELKNGLQMLKDLELCKQDLELEIKHLREENCGLNDLKVASCIAERGMEYEILSLKEIKEKLEAEVRKQTNQNDALQRQAEQMKEDIEDLHRKYQDLLQQVESVGIDPKCVGSTIKDLRDEYFRLKEISTEEKEEKEALLNKLEVMEGLLEKSAMLESFLSDVKIELERSKEKTKALEESRDNLSAEKFTHAVEKSALLSQLQMITETMQALLEKNASLESLLQCANIELEGLRVKSKSIEDVCQLLSNEKSDLQTERSNLISQLEIVEKKVESHETRFVKLEDKYVVLEKEKESKLNQVEELKTSLGVEKHDRECLLQTNESRLSGLEGRIDVLQQESKCRKRDFKEQLEKAVNAQVEIFILQKFLQDMEEKNYTLIAECQKHVESAKYSEKVISELESENKTQHREMEFLIGQVDNLRRGLFQVLKALEIGHVSDIEPEVFLPLIPSAIKGMKTDIVVGGYENQQLLIQNNVLSTVVGQLSLEGSKLATQKEVLAQELVLLNQKHMVLEHEKYQLQVRNGQLDSLVASKERDQELMEAQMENLNSMQGALQKECFVLQEKHSDVLETHSLLQVKLSRVEKENHILVEENSAAIVEALSFSNQSVVIMSSWAEKALELERISEEMHSLHEAYSDSKIDARALREQLAVKETENQQLGELIRDLEEKTRVLNVVNDQLNQKFLAEGEELEQKKRELFGAEERIKALQDANAELHTTIEGVERHSQGLDVIRGSLEQRISELTEWKECQEKEFFSLREANKSLENNLDLLNEEMEACKIREVILSSELNEQSCEFELWEAEASLFYFDLQTSFVREAVYEDKVQELSGLCNNLEDVSMSRSIEIETMSDKIRFLQDENEGLKSQLAAYVPAIASLKNNIVSLEQNPVLQTSICSISTAHRQQIQELIICDVSERHSVKANEEISSAPHGLSELQDLQSRIENIEAAIEDKIAHRKSDSKPYSAGSRTPKYGNGTRMKDIPLDYVTDKATSSNTRRGSDKLEQMLELWETDEEDPYMSPIEIERELGVYNLEVSKNMTEPCNEGRAKIITEKLVSDAQKLVSINVSVHELKRKIETINKKRNSAKAFEYERLRGQLQETEDCVAQLSDVNTKLTKAIDKCPSGNVSSTDEHARKEGEKIERLQLDVQNMQYLVLKMEDEKESKKGKSKFSRSPTGTVLKEFFIYSNGKRSGKPKGRFCGCFKPSSHKQV